MEKKKVCTLIYLFSVCATYLLQKKNEKSCLFLTFNGLQYFQDAVLAACPVSKLVTNVFFVA